MAIEMVAELAMGTAEIPESAPAEPVVVVVDIVPNMSTNDYDVSLILPSTLPLADVAVTDKTTNDVTLTVTRPDGYAGSPLVVHVLCIKRNDELDNGWVDVSANLDAGWTGTALIRKVASIVYLHFLLTPTATIDGTAKTDMIAVLSGLDAAYLTVYDSRGFCVDEAEQVLTMRADGTGTVWVRGTADVTGTWDDGVFGLQGQVSWVAGL